MDEFKKNGFRNILFDVFLKFMLVYDFWSKYQIMKLHIQTHI